MPEYPWTLSSIVLLDDASLAASVMAHFADLYRRHYIGEPFVNPQLPVEVRAVRRIEGWCVFLLLTPWMLARVYLAEHDPRLAVPAGWSAAERREAPAVVIGPALWFEIIGIAQQAHLNYDPALGHHLVQPLVQALDKFDSADAVFAAWSEVIAARQRIMEEGQRDCRWQRELSRREFFGRLAGR